MVDIFDENTIPDHISQIHYKRRFGFELSFMTTEGLIKRGGHFDAHANSDSKRNPFIEYFCHDLEMAALRNFIDTKKILENIRERYLKDISLEIPLVRGAYDSRVNLFYATILFGNEEDLERLCEDINFQDFQFSRNMTFGLFQVHRKTYNSYSDLDKVHPSFSLVYDPLNKSSLDTIITVGNLFEEGEKIRRNVDQTNCIVDSYVRSEEQRDRIILFASTFGFGDLSNSKLAPRRLRAAAVMLFAKDYMGASFSNEALEEYPLLQGV